MARYSLGVYTDDTEIQACLLNTGDSSIEKLIRRRREVVHGRPVNPLEADVKSVVNEIGQAAEKNVTALSGQYVMYRQMKRPFTDRKKIAETVAPEAETLLPVGDDLNVDFVIVGRDESGETLIEAASARKSSVMSIMKDFKGAGIEPHVIEAPSSAIAAGARNIFNLGPQRGYVVLHMGWRDTSICILHGNEIKHMGSAPLGFEKLLEAVAKDKMTSVNQVFEKALISGIDGGAYLERVVLEVMISLYKVPRDVEGYVAIPTGYAACINDLPSALETSDIDNNLPSLKGVIYDGPSKDMMLSFMAVSLAFRGEDKLDMVNFHQQSTAFSEKMAKFRAEFGVWIKAAIVLIILWGVGYIADTAMKGRINSKLSSELKNQFAMVMPPNTPMVDPVVQLEQRLDRLNKMYGAGGVSGESPLMVLKEISEKIPDNLNLVFESMNFDENALTLSGTTDSYDNVEKIKTGLSRIPFIKEVKIVSANVNKSDQKVLFKVTCTTGGVK